MKVDVFAYGNHKFAGKGAFFPVLASVFSIAKKSVGFPTFLRQDFTNLKFYYTFGSRDVETHY